MHVHARRNTSCMLLHQQHAFTIEHFLVTMNTNKMDAGARTHTHTSVHGCTVHMQKHSRTVGGAARVGGWTAAESGSR